ncbi:hypothetical protein [Mycobacterium sp. 94-17]|uniref:hypothetical protein n=1 Tax=Mycobacterium sp. 94-17 TaxID=2986147 RepID=UPI002D1E7721|nr:hypothetical protein [Mycobacterium sp. 94-17]MEB4212348.1 hypothetical protein [Mycobacterium sp. 94-17]
MVGDLPPAPGEGPNAGPPPSSTHWTPAFPTQPPPRPRTWPAIALAAIAVLMGIAALVVALTRPTSSQSGASSTTSTTPAYTADQVAAAHQKLCDAYKLAARAVQIETNGTNQAFAGIATVNGAVMLEEAVNNSPALAASERAAALALAESYSNVAATSSLASGQDPAWQSALNDANTKDAAMKQICGG